MRTRKRLEKRLPVPDRQGLSRYPNNLPVQPTSFIGRKSELVELRRLLAQSRLVTLTGTGGVGETRLAAKVQPS